MKNRMHNTFFLIFKNKKITLVITNLAYTILTIMYSMCRYFLKHKSKIAIEEAYSILNKCSEKPKMKTNAANKEIIKDLSIIVPAYNAEKTINECIDSVIEQNTKFDYELIIINDGSTDNTKQLIEKYNDSHIKLINQENRGFSGARNRGIDESCGRYIMFLDSDDYLVGNCIESMMNRIIEENADIIQASSYSFYETNNIKHFTYLKNQVIEKDKKQMTSNPGFPWAKIYKRELFNNLRFPLDVWFEDTIVCMILFRLSNKVVVSDEVVYAYRVNPQGITLNARQCKKCVDHYWVMEYVLEKAKELQLPMDALQYEMVRGHMSTLLYRRISLMDNEVMESAFVLACNMLENVRPSDYICKGNFIVKDIEKAFITKNYKLWKMASFVV